LRYLFSHFDRQRERMKGSSDDERYEPSPEADEEAMKIARIKLVSYWDEVFKGTKEEEGPDEWFVDFQTLEPLLRLGENMRILVAGCGFSALGIELAKRGHRVVNLDISRYKEEWVLQRLHRADEGALSGRVLDCGGRHKLESDSRRLV
jgi:cyclopropane fatty-acyl-phospholipid synthase-like methyltransferase